MFRRRAASQLQDNLGLFARAPPDNVRVSYDQPYRPHPPRRRTVRGGTLLAAGRDQTVGDVRWDGWQQVRFGERLKPGAEAVRAALLEVWG